MPPTQRPRRTRRLPATGTGLLPRRREGRRPRHRVARRVQGQQVGQPRPMFGRLPWLALLRRRRALRFLVFFDIGFEPIGRTPVAPTARGSPARVSRRKPARRGPRRCSHHLPRPRGRASAPGAGRARTRPVSVGRSSRCAECSDLRCCGPAVRTAPQLSNYPRGHLCPIPIRSPPCGGTQMGAARHQRRSHGLPVVTGDSALSRRRGSRRCAASAAGGRCARAQAAHSCASTHVCTVRLRSLPISM